MRIGIVGDLHGNSKWANYVGQKMGARKITHVFVVGDCGVWGGADGVEYLDDMNKIAEENSFTWFFLPGNHENYDIWNMYLDNMPTHKGFAMARRRVLLSPKIHHFKLANKQFVIAGGAVSIDKDYRLARERGGTYINEWGYQQDFGRGTGHRTLWWDNEELTDEHVSEIKHRFPKADILLTHDCSNFTRFKNGLKPDANSEVHRKRIDKVIASVKPDVHFHGHMHERYEWDNAESHRYVPFSAEWGGTVTKTYGMECDGINDSWGIFETDTYEFAYRGEGMNFRSLESE